MPKIGTNWNTLEPGDIVSFRYQSVVDKTKQPRTTTILVLNNKYQKKLKSGKTFIVGCYDKRDRRIEKRISWWLERLERL